MGGIRQFSGMKKKKLRWMIKHGFADPKATQNYSRSIEEFLEFMEAHKKYVVNGYVVSDTRDDYRLSIESIEKNGDFEDDEDRSDFIEFAHSADFFDVSGYAWWD